MDEAIPVRLADLAVTIQAEADRIGRGLQAGAAADLADMVRVMNCHYSNLIEGYNTRPRDIERALQGAELDPERRPLALEARAHVIVQREIDRAWAEGRLPPPTSPEFLSWVHRRFYEEMPPELRFVEHPGGARYDIAPGALRAAGDPEVAVGRHSPPSSARVAAFLDHFNRRYRDAGSASAIIAIAAAHHRVNFIRPFPDGNGRVSRLMSHAMALKAGIGANGLWSVSRGLARGLADRGEYMRMMDAADSPRRGDHDGRGNLSRAALEDFCAWFLEVMLDQIRFSARMFDVEGLEARYRSLVEDVTGDRRAPDLIAAVLRFGALPRGDAAIVLRTSERTARATLRVLTDEGFCVSITPKAPVRVAFPLVWRERLFPNLFAQATGVRT